MTQNVIEIRNLVTQFGHHIIHDHLNLDVHEGEILGIVGGSGTGKTVLLNSIIGLNHRRSGEIKVYDVNIKDYDAAHKLRWRWGVLYQHGALFSSLTVGENIKIPMHEIAQIPDDIADELVSLKLQMVGLEPGVESRMPSELSGGMIKRVALARALAIDAGLLFLDEPTAGLDPISAAAFDKLIRTLQKNLKLTVVMVTHDLDTLNAICDRIAVLVDKKVIVGTKEEIKNHSHPWIQSYFKGERGRTVFEGNHGNAG